MRTALHALAAALTLCACAAPAPGPPVHGQHPHTFTTTVQVTMTLDYLLHHPDDFGQGSQKWPLLVFLHGAGERGPDLQKVKVHGPPRLLEEGHALPFVVLSPQCPERDYWTNEAPLLALEALIDEIADDPRIDGDRIYLTGMSMGGFGVWSLAVRRPHHYAAIAPVCGGGDPGRAPSIVHVPTWAFHGELDDVVPVAHSITMIEAMLEAGGSPRLTLYPEANHDAWTQTYANEELYTWLLQQHRAARGAPEVR